MRQLKRTVGFLRDVPNLLQPQKNKLPVKVKKNIVQSFAAIYLQSLLVREFFHWYFEIKDRRIW